MPRLILAALLLTLPLLAQPLKQSATIPLDNVQGRIDHLAADPSSHRLYVAALGNNSLEVIDTAAAKRLTSITGLKKPQGVAVIHDLNRLAVASGEDGKLRLYDLDLKLLATTENLDDADNVRYDAAAKRLYVGYGDGALAVIDPQTGKNQADIKLDGHPESFQLAKEGPLIYVNVPSARHIAVVDRAKQSVIARWPTADAQANFPMALDDANHRLFVVCRKPAKLLTLDTQTGKITATADCCADADDLFLDAKLSRLYITGGEGFISIFNIKDATPTPIAKLPTAPGARTSLFVPQTSTLYLAIPHRDTQKAELRIFTPTP